MEVCTWTLDGVLDEVARIHRTMNDRQFAFILGAGASVTSGIPTGGQLASKWLRDVHLRECLDGRLIDEWLPNSGIAEGNISLKNAAEFYSNIFERRFDGDRESGYAELEVAMEGKSPSLGYSLLAEIIQKTRHKVVVTTNFDNLVADALAMHAHQSPLVVAHESLAGFVRPQLRRPLVAKIHRDLYLNPINDTAGVSTLEKGWKIALRKLFQYFTPIVVGYGGNDGSLMNMLLDLDSNDIAGRMIWCQREGDAVPSRVEETLVKHKGILVKISGFDEFMLQLAAKLVDDFDVAAIAERTAKLGQERADRYREQAGRLQESSAQGTPAEQQAGEVLKNSMRSDQDWWAWQMRANAALGVEAKLQVFQDGLRALPNSAQMHEAYAKFLSQTAGDAEAADTAYRKSLAIDPSNASAAGGYALFLKLRRKDVKNAGEWFKRALKLDPENVGTTVNYANYLAEQREDIVAADSMYKRALELDPSSALAFGNYALFLQTVVKNFDLAEEMYRRAIELDPGRNSVLGNYASFLWDIRHDADSARLMYARAIEVAPRLSEVMGYAEFLADQGEFEAANAAHLKAIDLDGNSSLALASYANFKAYKEGDFDSAEDLYSRALKLDPKCVNSMLAYAHFLSSKRCDTDAAREVYSRILEVDPKNEGAIADFANFLLDDANDSSAASKLLDSSVALYPNSVPILNAYGVYLIGFRKDFVLAQSVYSRIVSIDPNDYNAVANLAFTHLVVGKPGDGSEVLRLVDIVTSLVEAHRSQALAEALLYGAFVHSELGTKDTRMLARLKSLLLTGFDRGEWDFSPLFEKVVPRCPENERPLLRSLCDAVLDEGKVSDLDLHGEWRLLMPVGIGN